MRKSIKLPR